MSDIKQVNGEILKLSPEEQAIVDAARAEKAANQPMRDWISQMEELDRAITPRMVEDIYEFAVNGTPIPQEVVDVMTARQTKRGQRP
ncbi:MAG TPA: hypothetical protein DCG72_08935 [Gammaproteobacteria bacterium]|jgi:hypothetical protein|nr:hypothetical protein [Gammaproteobacteria bacterium]